MVKHEFLKNPDGVREEIMLATYKALLEQGYADLSTQHIADQFEKSKSLLYHHYDSKDELLIDFLQFMLNQYEQHVPLEDIESAEEHLDAILDHIYASPLPEERREFTEAVVELRAQAAYDPDYRDHFTKHDRFFRERLSEIIESGQREGVFRDVDADAVATYLVTLFNGSLAQRVTSDDDVTPEIRSQLELYLEKTLLKE